jgi:hypothetical protein
MPPSQATPSVISTEPQPTASPSIEAMKSRPAGMPNRISQYSSLVARSGPVRPPCAAAITSSHSWRLAVVTRSIVTGPLVPGSPNGSA